jgi:hypothetical protein
MAKKARNPAQVAAEKRRDAADVLGQLKIRHTKESLVALNKLQDRFPDATGPEIARMALIELAAKRNANR